MESPDVSLARASEPNALLEALALHQRGMFSDAEKIYDHILLEQPNHADALHYLGLFALQTQRPERSPALLRQAIGLNQNVAAYHSNLGLVLFSLNQASTAIASYDWAIALQPDYADADYNRAILLSSLRRPDEAVVGYHRVVALRPDHVAAHAGLGRELLRLGRHEAALVSLDTVIALQPDYAEAVMPERAAVRATGAGQPGRCHQQSERRAVPNAVFSGESRSAPDQPALLLTC